MYEPPKPFRVYAQLTGEGGPELELGLLVFPTTPNLLAPKNSRQSTNLTTHQNANVFLSFYIGQKLTPEQYKYARICVLIFKIFIPLTSYAFFFPPLVIYANLPVGRINCATTNGDTRITGADPNSFPAACSSFHLAYTAVLLLLRWLSPTGINKALSYLAPETNNYVTLGVCN